MKSLVIISAVFIIITSCSDESSLFDPTYFGEGFKGITFTLEGGPEPIKIDPTDWCYFIKTDTGGVSIPLGYSFGAAYPNPTTIDYGTTIPFTLPQTTDVYIYIINKDYKILTVLVNSTLAAGSYEIQLDTKQIGISGVFRVVFVAENIYCKGDIWIKGNSN